MVVPPFAYEIACLAALIVVSLTASGLARVGFPTTPEGKRVGCIDGLRGYLALFVFIGHALIWVNVSRGDGQWHGITLYPFGGLGAAAVPIFFMITGFLFYPRMLRGVGGNNWISVGISRVFRILPLVIASVAAVSAIIAIRVGVPADYTTTEFLKASALWISSLGEPPIFRYEDSGRINAYVFWSLKYEWIFYLLILPAMAVAVSLKPKRLPTVVIALAFLLATVVMSTVMNSATASYLPLFAVGMLAHEAQARSWLRELLASRGFSFVAVACLLASAAMPRAGVPVLNMALDGVFFAAIASGNSLWGLLRNKGALVLGECSFGIYVLHGLLLSCFFQSGAVDGASLTTVAFVLPLIALALVPMTAATFLAIERPCIAAGVRISRRLAGQISRPQHSIFDNAP